MKAHSIRKVSELLELHAPIAVKLEEPFKEKRKGHVSPYRYHK